MMNVFLCVALGVVPVQDREGIEFFESRIRPVLVERCYKCHSAQSEKLEGGLRVDSRAGLLKGGETGAAVVPGDPEKGLLIKAIRYGDENLQMPPKGRLSPAIVADFEAWVKRGAPDPREGGIAPAKKGIDIEKGREHWSIRPLAAAVPPAVMDGGWSRTPVDHFIRAKLQEKGIVPNGPADARKLLRRASLDLLGLPPSPEEGDAIEADPSPRAWEAALDRLLVSPHYGERWGRYWLDAARFGESHGYEQDYDRENAWPYRDFVIQALNQDMPYDRFVQWQIAGDELAPGEPLAWMATGFLGAGSFPTQLTEAEFESARYDELSDMTSTVGSAMLGLSVGCARCHDHKFDPIPTVDYYRMASTFTSTIRSHVDLDLDPEATRKALEPWEREHAPLVAALEKFDREELPGRYERWVAERGWEKAAPAWAVLEIVKATSRGGATFENLPHGSLRVGGENEKSDKWTFTASTTLAGFRAMRIEALADPALPKGARGRGADGGFSLGSVTVKAIQPYGPGSHEVVLKAGDWKGEGASKVLELPWAGFEGGTSLSIELQFTKDRYAMGRPRISVALDPAALESVPQAAAELIQGKSARPSNGLAGYRGLDAARAPLARAVAEHLDRKPRPKLTRVMVATEGRKPLKHHADERGFPHFYKETHVLGRGDVNRKQGVAEAGFLRVLTRDDEARWKSAHRRTALARWITDVDRGAGHLLARVIVNRLWHHHFGRGIVGTPNDFGNQGEPPTHPELLDWLAAELIRQGWRLKPIHKLLMMSAVYLESSGAPAEKLRADPENRLVWRWDLRRLEGEAIRDSMLFVGGILDPRMYGKGTLDEAQLRRSIYFMTKRSRLIPMLMTFDASEALVSIGSRPTTTVAPQALFFMNSPLARRCAAGLAKRVEGEDPVRAGFRLALGRDPSEVEREECAAYLRKHGLPDFCQVLLSMSEFVYVE